MNIKVIISIAVATAALAACSSSGSSNTTGGQAPGGQNTGQSTATAKTQTKAASNNSSSSVDVCGLLTSAQASSINHVTYGASAPKHVTSGWDQCSYTNTGKSDDPVDIQDLEVDVLTMSNCWSQLQQSLKATAGPAVSGIGDAAFGYGIGLAVKSGSRCIQIEGLTHAELMSDFGPDIAMAKIVLGKLG
jgi:hypothetical protein